MAKFRLRWYVWLGAITSVLAFFMSMVIYFVFTGDDSTAVDFLPESMRQEFNISGNRTGAHSGQQPLLDRYTELFRTNEVLRAKSANYDFLRRCASFLDDLPRNVICPGLAVVMFGWLCDVSVRRTGGTRCVRISTVIVMVLYHSISAVLALLCCLFFIQHQVGMPEPENPWMFCVTAVWLPISFFGALACSYSKDLLMKKSSLLSLTQSLSPIYVAALGIGSACGEVWFFRSLFYCLSDLALVCVALANFYLIYAMVSQITGRRFGLTKKLSGPEG
jgi:hypothetical protein